MLTHIEQKRLPYTPQQMFDLVVAVDRYAEFAPWCTASRITSREDETTFYADLVVGYKMFRERFSSKVIAHPPTKDKEGTISIEYLRGPLKHLTNHWRFTQGPDGSCTVDFTVNFEFKNKALQGLAHMFFKEVIHRMVDAFETRAQEIYGDASIS